MVDTSLGGPALACSYKCPRRNPVVAACNCCRFSVPTRHGQHVLPEVLHISTPSHLVPWVLLPHHSCTDPTQQLPRAVRESRPAWSWACPFTSDTARLRGIATPPAQSGGRHKRPGTGQHKDLSPPQAHALRFRGCDDPTSMAPLSCRCLGGQMSLYAAAKGLMTMLNSLDMGGDTRVSHQ